MNVKRIIDNKNSMCMVEMEDGSTGWCHIDLTTEAQRKAFVLMRTEELRQHHINIGMAEE
jgi:hypothetical protein